MESKDLMDKLQKVERSLNIYTKKAEDLVKEIDIDLPVETLKTIVVPKDGDPLLYLGYELDQKQLEAFNKILGSKIIPDLDSYYYVLECHGVYNW